MADKRSGPPSRGGPSKGGFSRGGGAGRSGNSRGGDSRGAAPRGGSFGGRGGEGRGGEGRPFGDRPQRSGGFEDRPRRSFGDRPQRSGGFEDRPRRDFGDRPPRDNTRGTEDRAPRRDRDMPFEDRPRRSFKNDGFGASRRRDDADTRRPRSNDGDRPQRSGGFEDRPRRDFGDRPPRRDFGDRPQRSGDFGDRPPRREFNSDRPRRDFGDRPPRRDFGDRPPRRDHDNGGFEPRKFESRKGFDSRPDGRDDRPMRQSRDITVSSESELPKLGMKGHELVIYGVHAVQAALRNPKRAVTTIWVTDIGEAHLADAYDATRHPETITLTRREIEQRLPEGAVHQGIAIAVEPLEEMYLSDVLAAANAPNADRQLIVVLDEVTDPHNVGAIMRSMSMFGASALIVHKRNAPSITGVMAKIATGAVEHVPMIPVTNLAKAMEELQMAGFYCLGLDEDAAFPINEAPKTGHMALVLGAEGDGLREKTRTTCNAIASIPAFGEIKSLNVSNAAAIALFSVSGK